MIGWDDKVSHDYILNDDTTKQTSRYFFLHKSCYFYAITSHAGAISKTSFYAESNLNIYHHILTIIYVSVTYTLHM